MYTISTNHIPEIMHRKLSIKTLTLLLLIKV